MPYIVSSKSGQTEPTLATAILFMLAMMAQSPLFLVAVFFKLPLPVHPEYASSLGKKQVAFAPKSSTVLPLHRKSTELRIRGKSSSFIVTEGRRSGDVWIDRGQAIAGLSKTGRLFSLLSPNPKLSVLPLRLGSDSNPSGVDHSTEHSARSNSILAYTISDKDVDEVAVVPRQVNSAMVNSWSAEQYESAGPANSRMGHKLQQGMACPKLPAPSIPLPPIPDESDPLHSRRATHYMPAIPNHYDENLKQMTSDETISDHAPMRPQPNVREKISRERSESISSVATPDDHSTPHQRGFKTAHSMVPMPSLESTVYPALQDYLPFSFHQTESTDRCGMFEASRAKDDGFGRPLDSVICTAIHAEATFSANDKQKSHIRRAKIESMAATGSVARRRHKKRRYTPLEGAQRARNTRHRSHRPKDSKTLYTLKMRRSMESSVSTTPTEGTESDIPATIAAPVEYLPAINRLSTILTDHASRLMELSEAKSVPRSRLIPPPSCREDPDLLKQRNAKECIKSDKQRSFGKHEKENNGHSQASCLIPLERTASARQRSLLTQTQGLPTVVVRPPSTSVATDPVLMMCDEML
ncbi:hypothetical protein FRC17_001965 [Serendipita sp. 399]|nr:hypothetical protein FRC17_001965 [Serendipita sp. 399]